jgi:hypothetical protein
MDNIAIAGFKLGRKAWLAEGKEFVAAYHELRIKTLGAPGEEESEAGPE